MRNLFTLFACALTLSSMAQNKGSDGRWIDHDLTLQVEEQAIQTHGTFTVCVAKKSSGLCIQNLLTPFSVKVYDDKGKEIWNGLYTGMVPFIEFKKALPHASRLDLVSGRDFVINVLTGTRIYTGKPLKISISL